MSSFWGYVLTVVIVFSLGLLMIRLLVPRYVQYLLQQRIKELPEMDWKPPHLPPLSLAEEEQLERMIQLKAKKMRESSLSELQPPLDLLLESMDEIGQIFYPKSPEPRWMLSPEQFVDALLRTSDLLRRELHHFSFQVPWLGHYNLGAWILEQPIQRYIQATNWLEILTEIKEKYGALGETAGTISKFVLPLATGGTSSILTHTLKEAGIVLAEKMLVEQYARIYVLFSQEIIQSYSMDAYRKKDEEALLWEVSILCYFSQKQGWPQEVLFHVSNYIFRSPRSLKNRERALSFLESQMSSKKTLEKPDLKVISRTSLHLFCKTLEGFPAYELEDKSYLRQIYQSLQKEFKESHFRFHSLPKKGKNRNETTWFVVSQEDYFQKKLKSFLLEAAKETFQKQPFQIQHLLSLQDLENKVNGIQPQDAVILHLQATPATWEQEKKIFQTLKDSSDAFSVLVVVSGWEYLPPSRGWKIENVLPCLPGNASEKPSMESDSLDDLKLQAVWNVQKEIKKRFELEEPKTSWLFFPRQDEELLSQSTDFLSFLSLCKEGASHVLPSE